MVGGVLALYLATAAMVIAAPTTVMRHAPRNTRLGSPCFRTGGAFDAVIFAFVIGMEVNIVAFLHACGRASPSAALWAAGVRTSHSQQRINCFKHVLVQ